MAHLHDQWDEKMAAVIDGLDTIPEWRTADEGLKRDAATAILHSLTNAGFIIRSTAENA